MARLLNCPRLPLVLGIVALIISAALACGFPSTSTEALPLPTETSLPVRDSAERRLLEADFWRFDTEVEDVRDMLDQGADVNATDDYGRTPLHLAAVTNYESSVIELLLSRGADVNARNNYGSTPLHNAVEFIDELPIIALLLDRGADANAKDDNGETPLHMAAAGLNDEPLVIILLLARGADVNARDNYGGTPLHRAARWNESPAVIKILLYSGVDVSARDLLGHTPCDLVLINNVLAMTEAYDLLCR